MRQEDQVDARSVPDSTMASEAYNRTSAAQLRAHSLNSDALQAASARLSKREGVLRICDLGVAGGANAIHIMRRVAESLPGRVIEYALEALPQNDWNELVATLQSAELPGTVFPRFIARSFYEPLFPEGSLHLCLSYITLHWLSGRPTRPIQSGEGAVMANERGVNALTASAWREQAHADLTHFLSLRARELCTGGDGVFLMVSAEPCVNGWVQPPSGGASIFSEAVSRAVKSGQLTAEEAARAVVPYYLRSKAEVEAAVAAVPELELIELRAEKFVIASEISIDEHADFAWSIHSHSIAASTHASAVAVAAVRAHLPAVIVDAGLQRGSECGYISLAVRKRCT
mmetsp:Transcript_31982/g.67310  ORF Transcript_31982/g.67310 Transcript_31982/m.67310 type:complete len:344 (-) Transcript_31982:397-1428(-)